MRHLRLIHLILALTIVSIPIIAQSISEEKAMSDLTDLLPVTNISMVENDMYCCLCFEVEAPETANYYANFWLLPTKYSDGTYTKINVYVNDSYIGDVSPNKGNWQAIGIDGKEFISLTEGFNRIVFCTKSPEIPAIEAVKIATKQSSVSFDSELYQKFLYGAHAGNQYKVNINDIGTDADSYDSNSSAIQPVEFSDIPLLYTFYRTFNFKKGQDVFITSTGQAEHDIDLVFYGTGLSLLNSVQQPQSVPYVIIPPVVQPKVKLTPTYTPATSREMQGLNWKRLSEKSINSTTQVATMHLTIPQSGTYLVRLRNRMQGATAVADLNVNGLYYYDGVPISFVYVPYTIPANGKSYATMTKSKTDGRDDPFIFIHGVAADRIVGFNDDATSSERKENGLTMFDSYINQSYLVKTSGISVSNYSSADPVSVCTIISKEVSTDVEEFINMPNLTQEMDDSTSIESKGTINISNTVELNGSLIVTSTDAISSISTYTLFGDCLGMVKVSDYSIRVPLSSLGIYQTGIHIITVETADALVSKRVVVK